MVTVGEGALQQLRGRAAVWRSSGVRAVRPLPARLAMSASTGAHRVSNFSLRSSADRAQVLIAVWRWPAEAARSPSCRGSCGPVTHCREHVRSFRAGVSPRRGGW